MSRSKAAAELRRLLKPTPPPMTQQSLAEALGVTQQAVSSWLNGRTKPTRETREKIEALLGVPVSDWEPMVADSQSGAPSVQGEGAPHESLAASPAGA